MPPCRNPCAFVLSKTLPTSRRSLPSSLPPVRIGQPCALSASSCRFTPARTPKCRSTFRSSTDGSSSTQETTGKLYAEVSNLANSPEITDDQQAELNRLWATWSIRQANAALTAGDQRRALAILDAAARAFPKDAGVYTALAGAYLKAGQPKRAVAIYASLDMSHATADQYRAAIGAALAAKDMKQAETWLQAALDEYKNDASILRMAAQFEQARGDNQRAAAYYRAALAAMGPAPGGIFAPPTGSSVPGARRALCRQPSSLWICSHPQGAPRR